MAARLRFLVTSAALVALLGCTPTSSKEGTTPEKEAATAKPSDTAAPVASQRPDPRDEPWPEPTAPTEPPNPMRESHSNCTWEQGTDAERTAACIDVLELTAKDGLAEGNMLSERADAIRTLYALKHTTPVTAALRKASASSLKQCVVVHDQSASGLVDLMCYSAMCADPAEWHPHELVLATGRLKVQQC